MMGIRPGGAGWKKRFVWLIPVWMLLILAVFPSAAFAAQKEESGEDVYQDQLEASGAQELPQQLPEETRQLLEELGLADFSGDGVFRLSFEDILSQTAALAQQKAAGPLRAAFCVIGIIALCALLQSVKTSFLNDEITHVFSIACVLMTAALMVTPLVSVLTRAQNTALGAFAFLISFVPVYAGIMRPLHCGCAEGLFFYRPEEIAAGSVTAVRIFRRTERKGFQDERTETKRAA